MTLFASESCEIMVDFVLNVSVNVEMESLMVLSSCTMVALAAYCKSYAVISVLRFTL